MSLEKFTKQKVPKHHQCCHKIYAKQTWEKEQDCDLYTIRMHDFTLV